MRHTRFSIAPAGWFSVAVRSHRSSRLTQHSRHVHLQPAQALERNPTDPQFTLFQAARAEKLSGRLLRTASIAVAAATIMWLLLSWLCSYGTWQ